MKVFSAAILALFSPAAVSGHTYATCAQQDANIEFTVTRVSQNFCGGTCYYNICMKFTGSETIRYTCEKDVNSCHTNDGFLDTYRRNYAGTNYEHCQKVAAGDNAQFLIKDAGTAGECGIATKGFTSNQGDFEARCKEYTQRAGSGFANAGSCGGAAGKECVWTLPAPDDCTSTGGSFGDPHIKRWNRKTFDFHGECDLVLVHSDHVNGEDPLDLHIRTTIQGHWSSVTSAALRVGEGVGEVILQMDLDKFYVNGVEYDDSALPMQTSQFSISEAVFRDESRIYVAELNDKSRITFKIIKNFMTVAVSGSVHDFEHSVGLLGDFHLGKPYDRVGNRVYDFEEYGLEWQVRADEPKLFMDAREPQLPHASCRFPDAARPSRRLRSSQDPELFEQAQTVCAHKEDYDACLDDVMYTGELALAHAW
jgi:hypothetical protein